MVKKGKETVSQSNAVKKGKEKAPASGSSTAKKSAKKAAAPEDDLLIFTTDKKKSKGGPSNKPGDAAGSSAGGPDAPPEPPKPTVKQIIGGSSWTGKLPVNLLSEHCQRMKWERPDYDMVSSNSSTRDIYESRGTDGDRRASYDRLFHRKSSIDSGW